LIQNNKDRIFTALDEINLKFPSPNGFILILDAFTTRLISGLFKLSDLLEKNII
jgi:hypothetical protein